MTDLNTALLVDRSPTAAISYISSASVMQKSVKIDQSGDIPDSGIPERPFVKFANRRSLASSRRVFLFFCALFSALRPDQLNAWKRPEKYVQSTGLEEKTTSIVNNAAQQGRLNAMCYSLAKPYRIKY